MQFCLSIRFWLIMAAVAALSLTNSSVFAHERRDLGQYTLTVGWEVEPPVEGQKNAVFLRVVERATEKPTEGLEKTLKVDVTHLSTNTTKAFDLEASDEAPGVYTAALIPTEPGGYRFHFTGTIEGTGVDQTFASGPNTFDEVGSSEALQFPVAVPSGRELQSAVRGATDSSSKAVDRASSASTRGTVALALGVVGVLLGAVGTVLAFRKR
jgi:hypothetical protein